MSIDRAPDGRTAAAALWPSARAWDGERQLKREAVLAAAVELFNARGVSGTSLDDVAGALGITKPLIYRYVGGKDQLLLECVKRGFAQFEEAVAAVSGFDGSGIDRLRRFLLRYAAISSYGFGMCAHRTGDHELSEESRREFRARKRGIDQAMRFMIEQGIADGTLHTPDVRMATFAMAGALNWIARWYTPEGPLAADEVASRIVDTLLSGLAPRTVLPAQG